MRDLWFLSKKRSFGKGAVPSFGAEVMKIMDTNDMMHQLKNFTLHASRFTLHASPGFNLVEISLALMVVAIGLLSVLSLFPAGLDQNVRSVGDTHAALFAGEVLNGLRAHAETNWDGIGNSITNLFVAADSTWNNPGELDPHLNNTIRTNVYRRQSNTNIVDHAFRYRLQITTNDKIKAATLQVWNGQFGSISNPIIFYTEFYKFE